MPPFLLGDSYGDARMGISRVLGLCAALLFASSVTAANIIDLGPSDYRNWGSGASHASGGVRSSLGQSVRLPPTLNTLNVTRNAVIPYGSIANGLRQFTRINPASIAASAAVTGLFLAVDWAFDEASGTWKKEGFDIAPYDDSYTYWEIGNVHGSYFYSGARGASPLEACQNGIRDAIEVLGVQPASTGYACVYRTPYGQSALTYVTRRGSGCPPGYAYNNTVNACAVPGYIDLDPSDWQTLEGSLPQRAPELVADAASDSMKRQGGPLSGYQDQTITGPSSVSGPETTSTSTDPVTGDTVVTTTNTTTNISYGDTTITTTNTTTSTTYQNGQQTSTTVTTETPGELPVDGGGVPPAGEWPGFCDWATVVCDWLNWTQEEPPPDVDLPQIIDDDFFNEKTISFGAKSCPPDHEINLTPFLETTVGVSFQPLCDFASLIYYMVMAASYIIAAYISIGVARNG